MDSPLDRQAYRVIVDLIETQSRLDSLNNQLNELLNPFILERLKNGDVESIKELLSQLPTCDFKNKVCGFLALL